MMMMHMRGGMTCIISGTDCLAGCGVWVVAGALEWKSPAIGLAQPHSAA